MSFKPNNDQQQTNSNSGGLTSEQWLDINRSVKSGSRPARVSLIVDLGLQERDPFTEPYVASKEQVALIDKQEAWVTEEKGQEIFNKKQTPAQQVIVFADLVSDIADYGGKIGKQPYRIMLNSKWDGEIKGTTFGAVPPQTDRGLWTFHPNSMLTKLAKATGKTQIISEGRDNMDISLLLGQAFMATVEVKETESKGKTYVNVNYKGCSPCPEMPDGSLFPVPELNVEPMCITFENITPDMVKFLRKDVLEKIKKAQDYPGSHMQEVLEGSQTSSSNDSSEDTPNPSYPTGGGENQASRESESATEGLCDDFDYDSEIPF